MLLGNYSYINFRCGHNHSGVTNPYNFIGAHISRGWYGQQNNDNISIIKYDSLSTGTQPPYSLMMGDLGSLLSATTTVSGGTTISNGNLAGGLNAVSSLTGSGTLTGSINAIAAVIAALSGLGTVTADITGKLEAAASLLGSGDITAALGALSGAVADIIGTGSLNNPLLVGAINASSDLSGTGTLTFASDIIGILEATASLAGSSSLVADIVGAWFMESGLTGSSSLTAIITSIANLIADLSGSGVLTASVYSSGSISADITSDNPLSPESLAAALWNALAADFNIAGTMGEIMNNVGSGADPWSTVLPASYTGDQAGAIVDRLETLIKQIKTLTLTQL